jgi:hypothetical protein
MQGKYRWNVYEVATQRTKDYSKQMTKEKRFLAEITENLNTIKGRW